MALLVDECRWPAHGRLWCHLVSDVSFEELHQFAAQIDLPPRAFHKDHYDLPESIRSLAVSLGAQEVGSRELVRRLRLGGLRRRGAGRSEQERRG